MLLFYTEHINNNVAQLSAEEAAHALKSLRLKPGGQLYLADGKGNLYNGTLLASSRQGATASVVQIAEGYGVQKCPTHIAIAPTKNPDRIEWFVEKAVEIGITEISLLECEHSERTRIKLERLERIAQSAMKQSLKAIMPIINEVQDFELFMQQQHVAYQQHFIAHCVPDDKQQLPQALLPGQSMLLLIGPEGDFSDKEINQSIAQGFKPVSLGDARLRTETAALYGVVVHNAST